MSKFNIHQLIKAANQELDIGEQFRNDLQRSIELDSLKQTRLSSKTYKPSSLGCLREMYFQRIGEEPDESAIDSNLVGILESGTDRHDRIQEAITNMRENNIDCDYIDVAEYIKDNEIKDLTIVEQIGHETKLFHEKLIMSFMCDGIIRYKDELYILEIKTETIYKWQSRQDVADEHILQATAYSTCLEIPKVMFLYENRDFCGKKAYCLDITDKMREDLKDMISRCEEYVERREVPPMPRDKKICRYCRYKTTCNKAGIYYESE